MQAGIFALIVFFNVAYYAAIKNHGNGGHPPRDQYGYFVKKAPTSTGKMSNWSRVN
jgi:hypothetical protein